MSVREIHTPSEVDVIGANSQNQFLKDKLSGEEIKAQPLDAVDIQDEIVKPIEDGVNKIEAITISWSSMALWTVYISLWMMYFNKSLENSTTGSFAPYATSDFKAHSLLPVLTIISSMVSSVMQLPLSKLLNMYGRSEGFLIMVTLSVLGSVLAASTGNVGTYFAAKIFKTIGNNGLDFVGTVIISDMTSLLSRAFWLGLTATPYIATTFAGPAIAGDMIRVSTWRWGYGIFAITTPVVCAGVLYVLFREQQAVKKREQELTQEVENPHQSLRRLFWELDIIGLLLICAGFVLVFLAVTLAKYNGSTWRSDHIVAMLVVGPVLLICFGIWEKSYSKLTNGQPVIPFYFLKDRTILGACIMATVTRVTYYIWDNFFNSYLQVVHRLNVKDAGYVNNIYSIVTCAWAPLLGLIIRKYGRVKHIALIAVAVHLLGAGLMIRFRYHDTSIGLVCMCQILLAWGGGTLTNTEEIIVMAAAGSHTNVASVLAFKALFAYIGSAMGSAISGAMWNNMMPKKLVKYLPQLTEKKRDAIFESLKVQLAYKWGSPERMAIVSAYQDVQKIMTISATSILVVASICVFVWKDLPLRDVKQTKGRLL